MKKIIFSFLFFIFSQNVLAESMIVKKVHEAQELLKKSDVAFETTKTKKIVAKKSVLAAWDQDENKIYEVYIRIPFPLPKNITIGVLSDGFAVEHVYGRYLGKFIFNVSLNGKKLIVLAGKHLLLPPSFAQNQNYETAKRRVETVIYTPFSDDLYDKEAVKEGFLFLEQEIRKTYEDLRAKQIVSRAVSGKILAEAHAIDYLLNLAINEQMDHGKFNADAKHTADEILIEYAFNRDATFRWAVSSADARGPFQFTNRGGRGNAGTYDAVVANYEDIGLIEDFEVGTQDLENMIKVALALIDMELAKFPPDVHELYEKDYRKAAIYSSACYNGGYGTGLNLYKWIKKNHYEITLDNFNPSKQAFTYIGYRTVYSRDKNGKKIQKQSAIKIINTETPVYLKKQMFLWGYLDRLKEDMQMGN